MTNLFPSAQGGLDFPLPLCEKYRPRTIADFVGLDKQKKILSAFARRPVPCAWLFWGASGLGKSTIAMALAEEMKAELHKIPSQKCTVENIEEVVRLCHYVPFGGGMHVIQADEADRMTPSAKLQLLSKLDGTSPVPNTVWIFTANDVEGLETGVAKGAFLSRCRVLEFSNYSMANPIADYLAKVWESETGRPGNLNWLRMVKDNANNVRACLSALELELLAA